VQARRIAEHDGDATEVGALLQHVARRAGNVRDNGALLAEQRVEEAGLAGVGPPDDGDVKAVAQEPAASVCLQEACDLLDS